MSTFSRYIGIPFEDRKGSMESADCYGLVRLIYLEELGIEIPSFTSSCLDTKRIFSDYLYQIARYWDLVDEPKVFDVVAMAYDPQHPKIVQHFGIYIGNGMLLHTLKGVGTFIVKLSEFQPYIKGVYRWRVST